MYIGTILDYILFLMLPVCRNLAAYRMYLIFFFCGRSVINLQCVSVTYVKFWNATVTRDDYHCANEHFASNFTSRAQYTGKFVQFCLTREKKTRQSVCIGDVFVSYELNRKSINKILVERITIESSYNLYFFHICTLYLITFDTFIYSCLILLFVLYYILVRTTFTSNFIYVHFLLSLSCLLLGNFILNYKETTRFFDKNPNFYEDY